MKVFNNTDRVLPVERWTIFPKSTRCVNQQGQIREELPDEVAFGSVVKRLETQGAVALPSFGKVVDVPAVPVRKLAKTPVPQVVQHSEPVAEVDVPKKPTEKRKKWK